MALAALAPSFNTEKEDTVAAAATPSHGNKNKWERNPNKKSVAQKNSSSVCQARRPKWVVQRYVA
jgi:hypothetical protein